MPAELSERSTTIRPSPALPRRKSTSRSACGMSVPFASAKRCTCTACADGAAWSVSVTSTALPSTLVSNVCGLLRLNTTRVRFPAWMRLRLRNAGSATSRCVTPMPLAVSRKSSAIRGGLCTEKPAGGFAGGDFSWNLTMVLPEDPRVTLTCSRLLPACASAMPESASAQRATKPAAHPRRVAAPAPACPMP